MDISTVKNRLANRGSSFSLDEIKDALDSLHGVPKTLIVTNVPEEVYTLDEYKDEFEKLFLHYDPGSTFAYLRSFQRVKVFMTRSEAALMARVELHKAKLQLANQPGAPTYIITCYFAEEPSETYLSDQRDLLEPPKPTKQYLISPPASPPVGWEPGLEAEPCINLDLLAALAGMVPGVDHELHPPKDGKPAIVVTPCEENRTMQSVAKQAPRQVIQQTRCPDRRK